MKKISKVEGKPQADPQKLKRKKITTPKVKGTGESSDLTTQSTEVHGVGADLPSHDAAYAEPNKGPSETTGTLPGENEELAADNDNIVTLEELGLQIVDYHVKAEASEKEASINVWESGTRLNQAYDRVYADRGYGSWGNYLKQNCPALSRTTVWRYRKVASCFPLEQAQANTLSELYASCSVADFQEEQLADGTSEPTIRGSGSSGKTENPYAKVLGDLSKASEKFDAPTSMSKFEQTAVKEVAAVLEEVHGKINKPSIIAITWQDKLGKPVAEWEPDELCLFEAEFARLVEIHQQIQASKEGA